MTKIIVTCKDCNCKWELEDDVAEHEVVSCPDCGLEFEVIKQSGSLTIKELVLDGEDWGE